MEKDEKKWGRILAPVIQEVFFFIEKTDLSFFEIGKKIYYVISKAVCWLLPSNGDRDWNETIRKIRSSNMRDLINGFMEAYYNDEENI